MQKTPWCPACHNSNPDLMQDNGLLPTDPDYALLCMAPSGPFCDVDPDDPDSMLCGMQWEPNRS